MRVNQSGQERAVIEMQLLINVLPSQVRPVPDRDNPIPIDENRARFQWLPRLPGEDAPGGQKAAAAGRSRSCEGWQRGLDVLRNHRDDSKIV